MALPPSIPTSFVPRSASAPVRRFRMDFMGAFGFLAYVILVGVVALAIGVFVYDQILDTKLAAKNAELAKAQQEINSSTAEEFVRLNNQLTWGKTLLANHTALSGFFAALEKRLPATVRFSSLHLTVTDTKKLTLEAAGVARSFNALALASDSFAKEGTIKDVIFSHLTVNKDNSVSFALTATIEPALVAFAPSVAALPVLSDTVATSTASSTTP